MFHPAKGNSANGLSRKFSQRISSRCCLLDWLPFAFSAFLLFVGVESFGPPVRFDSFRLSIQTIRRYLSFAIDEISVNSKTRHEERRRENSREAKKIHFAGWFRYYLYKPLPESSIVITVKLFLFRFIFLRFSFLSMAPPPPHHTTPNPNHHRPAHQFFQQGGRKGERGIKTHKELLIHFQRTRRQDMGYYLLLVFITNEYRKKVLTK